MNNTDKTLVAVKAALETVKGILPTVPADHDKTYECTRGEESCVCAGDEGGGDDVD